MSSTNKVFEIYNALTRVPGNQFAISQAWGAVFKLDSSVPEFEDDVVILLTALRKEIDNTRSLLITLGVPLELTEPGFQRFKDTASATLLHQAWDSHKKALDTAENKKIFEWAAWVLKDETAIDINEEDLSKLLTELHDLEVNIQKSTISDQLKFFLLENIKKMRHAILLGKVEGVDAIKSVVDTVAGSFVTINEELVKEVSEDTESKRYIKTFFETFQRFANAGESAEKFLALGKRVGQAAGEIYLNFMG